MPRSIRSRFLMPLICLAMTVAAVAPRARGDEKPFDPKRWEKDIAAFEKQDRQSPPPRNAILFVGSSSIVRWNVRQAFPGRPAINRGFGGSHIADSVYYAPRIVLPYRPAMIVFYAGENDIAAGKTPQQVAADFRQFVEKVRADRPEVPILFIGLKPSPSRWSMIEKFRQTNQLIGKYIASQSHMEFLDFEKPMLGPDGTPNADLFVSDRLHLSAKGYELWNRLLEPHLPRVSAAAQPAK